LILLLLRGKLMRFNALRRAIEGISHKMLSQVLKGLERRDTPPRHRRRAGRPRIFDHAARRLARERRRSLRDWAEHHLKEVMAAQRRYGARHKPMVA